MELTTLDSEHTSYFVKEFLKKIGYTSDLEIETYITDNSVNYLVKDFYSNKGNLYKRISTIKDKDYKTFLKYALRDRNIEVTSIDTLITDDKVIYNISYELNNSYNKNR